MSADPLLAKVDDAVGAIRLYAGTECFEHFCALLTSLEESYKGALVQVSKEELPLLQGATRQVIALRNAITAPVAAGHTPRI